MSNKKKEVVRMSNPKRFIRICKSEGNTVAQCRRMFNKLKRKK